MGLSVSVMRWEMVEYPKGVAYDFAWEMAIDGVDYAYATGENQSDIPFTQRGVLRLLDEFTEERGLSRRERREILAWLKSLPWIYGGWRKRLPKDDGRDQEWRYHAARDNEDGRDGGLIELHFSW